MRKLIALTRTCIADALTYRADVLLFVVAGISHPVVYLALWLALIASGNSLPATAPEMVNYFLLVIVINLLVGAWATSFIARDIRLGELSKALVKPVPNIFWPLANNLGEKFVKLIYVIPIVIVLGFAFKSNIPPLSLTSALIMLLSVLGAAIISFFMDICIGLLAFWLENVDAIDDVFGILFVLLSGQLIPLFALPEPIRNLAIFLPFRYIISFPIEIALQKLTSFQIIQGAIAQILWIGLLVGMYTILWRKGLKRYSAVGG